MTDSGQLEFDEPLGDESPRGERTIPEAVESGAVDDATAEGDDGSADQQAENLLISKEAEPLADTAGGSKRRLYFLTNRMNLNGVLGSRVLGPRESFHKYYADLLQLCPGWVPLLTGPPSPALVEKVMAERGAGAPVLLEFEDSLIGGRETDNPVVYVPAVPASDVRAIHFRESKALREHRARSYRNVHPHDELLQVSPELFAQADEPAIQIDAPAEAGTTDWRHLDRVRGAANAALAAADTGEALAIAAGVLGAHELPDSVKFPTWLRWRELAGDDTRVVEGETEAALADRLTFQAAYRVLGSRDVTEAWIPTEVLEAVAAEIETAKPSKEAAAIIDRNLQRVRELVNVEREFEPFRDTGSALVSAKALLLILLRPDLGQLVDWPVNETGADEVTRVAAAVLAGRLRGLAREDVQLRNQLLDDVSAAWAVGVAHGERSALGALELLAEEGTTTLLLNGGELQVSESLTPDPVAGYEALPADARESARVALSRRMGWPVVVRVSVPAGAQVEPSESAITITSAGDVSIETLVDEDTFLARLRTLSGSARRLAVDTLILPKQPSTTRSLRRLIPPA